MSKRRPISAGKSRKIFRRGSKTHGKNELSLRGTMRGGIRF